MKKIKMMKKNYEFRNVLSKGTYYSGEYIEAFIKKNNKKEVNYLGIAIGVKLAKAVKRNYLKRLIRENYQMYDKFLKPGNLIVFLWKKKANTKHANYDNINKDMKKIFIKANLLEENI